MPWLLRWGLKPLSRSWLRAVFCSPPWLQAGRGLWGSPQKSHRLTEFEGQKKILNHPNSFISQSCKLQVTEVHSPQGSAAIPALTQLFYTLQFPFPSEVLTQHYQATAQSFPSLRQAARAAEISQHQAFSSCSQKVSWTSAH